MLSINSLFYYYDVCVRSAHRKVLPYLIVLDLRHTSWPLRKGYLLSFYPAFPLADKLRDGPLENLWGGGGADEVQKKNSRKGQIN